MFLTNCSGCKNTIISTESFSLIKGLQHSRILDCYLYVFLWQNLIETQPRDQLIETIQATSTYYTSYPTMRTATIIIKDEVNIKIEGLELDARRSFG
jgi:hypothetical protein